MPTREDLQGIVSYDRYNPSIDTDYFPNTTSSGVWSGSPYAGDSGSAWYVYFVYGISYYNGCVGGYQVRLVRGGQ